MNNIGRLEQLTFLRFPAASLVVIFHYGRDAMPFTEGRIAITPTLLTFFFVLSGFVLSISYIGRKENLRRYVLARAARILPVYYLSLAIAIAVLILAGKYPSLTSLGLTISLMQSWIPGYPQAINAPAWSLSVEMFLYALFPAILLAIKHYQASAKQVLITAGLLWLLTQLITISARIAFDHQLPPPHSTLHDLTTYFPPSNLCSFVIGIGVGLWFIERRPRIKSNWGSILLVTVVTVLALAPLRYRSDFYAEIGFIYDVPWSFFAPMFAALILAFACCDSGFSKFLGSKPLAILGSSSYALYILQVPIEQVYRKTISPLISVSADVNFWIYYSILVAISVVIYLSYERVANDFILYSLPKKFPALVGKSRH